MRATPRRHRTPTGLLRQKRCDTFCQSLREQHPELISQSEKELLRFLYAVRDVERRPVTDTRRGCPPSWRREDLLKAAGALRPLMGRETGAADFTLQLHGAVPAGASLPF